MKQADYACVIINTTNKTRNTKHPLSIYNLESKSKRNFSLCASAPSSRRIILLSSGLPGGGMSNHGELSSRGLSDNLTAVVRVSDQLTAESIRDEIIWPSCASLDTHPNHFISALTLLDDNYSVIHLVVSYSLILVASLSWPSVGQYGHLYRAAFTMLCNDSIQITWPQASIIGGFSCVVCSLLTGQTKMGW